ncbi:MAG: hypothetical protein FWC59_00505 [Actinomycetia bacterium]|nr:hypothetical protein [Actinomycetes bacterium]
MEPKTRADLYAAISQRKSCRKYDMTSLAAADLASIDAAIAGMEQLDPELRLTYRYSQKAKGLFHIEAPHYLVVEGSGAAGELEAAGFLFQQLDLWLNAQGLGSVWLGSSRDAETKNERDIIMMGFGRPRDNEHRRQLADFKRVPIAEMTNAPDDLAIQAVHLAPSGRNLQPWYLEQNGDGVLVYYRLPSGLAAAYKLTDLDMGIALAHYMLAARHQGRDFHFQRSDDLPAKAGWLAFGWISC